MSENENLFQLVSGRYIASAEISDKMFTISHYRPEAVSDEDTGFSWDESGMAELFAECYKNDTRYCPERKSWYTYDHGKWVKDLDGLLVSNKCREFVRLMVLYCGEIRDEEKRKSYLTFVNKMGDRRFRDRLIKDARDNLAISAREFDNKPYLINCLNGTYDLSDFSFREHRWDDFLTMQTAFEYTVQTDSRCERWEQFIKEVTSNDAEKADFLQRALGYSLLGTAKEECMFILHGKTTRNGKSTMLNTIENLLGDYSTVSPVSIICRSDRSANAEAASPTLARLKGKRFVTMAESNQYGKLDEETIKQLTGGEEITARNLYEAQMTYLPQFTLWLSCNDLPAVQDKSLFASDRIKVIEFNRHFSASERDETLKDLFKTPEAQKGIFHWLIIGYAKYLRKGLSMSEDMQDVINQYERDNDIVLQYLEEKCEVSAEDKVKCKSLYDSYKVWCKANGYYVMSSRKFYSGVDQHPEWYEGKTVSHGYPVYTGLRLKV